MKIRLSYSLLWPIVIKVIKVIKDDRVYFNWILQQCICTVYTAKKKIQKILAFSQIILVRDLVRDV